jgi:glycosyltransferase involved in cell wall biosynthesis
MFDMTVNLLKTKGHTVIPLALRSGDITGIRGKLHAFTSGLYSYSAYSTMANLIKKEKPDIVHVHDLYPLLVWVLPACRKAGIPVVMSVHNYRLTCPTLFHLHEAEICEKCWGGREYQCILKNCRKNVWESTAYAMHNFVARKFRLFLNNINLYLALTEFQKNYLAKAGFPNKKLRVLPNMVDLPKSATDTSRGKYVAYAGRFSAEKGIEVLLAAAELNPKVPIYLAGDHLAMPHLIRGASKNVYFMGHLTKEKMQEFYRESRFLVVPSTWFEVCPLAILEAMGHGLPIIASRIGSMQEIVEDGQTGLLFEKGNSEDLSRKIDLLWKDHDLCHKMSRACREKAIQAYSQEVHYTQLIALYNEAIQIKLDHSISKQ